MPKICGKIAVGMMLHTLLNDDSLLFMGKGQIYCSETLYDTDERSSIKELMALAASSEVRNQFQERDGVILYKFDVTLCRLGI